ncbi:MAG TPA: ABC transporter permease, partial [Vicinamibacterales bacterium]|nr:ABC transporter permease [Vicinamibacterales bacterium]
MEFLRHDLTNAWRALIRSRGYMAAVVVTLGVGIGVNTAIFSLADAVLLKPLPYPEPDRLVRIAEWPHAGGNFTMAPAAYLVWRDQARSFSHFEARIGSVLAVAHGNTVEEISGVRVTPGYFDMLGITPGEGRTFTPDDTRPGAACVAVVSRRFQDTRPGDGRSTLRINGTPCDVVGVLPPDTVFDRVRVDIYLPLAFTAAQAQNQGRSLTVLGRLRDGVTIEAASSEMASIAATFNASRGPAGRGWTTALTPLRDVVIGADVRWLARVLFAAVLAVLLVGCLNVAGLSVTRTMARRRELAIRMALGASRTRLFRHVIAESVVLAVLGGAAGVLLGSWGLRAFLALSPAGTIPVEADVSLDGRALLFTAVVAIATALLSGIVPAMRGTSAPASEALAGTRTAGPSRSTALVHRSLLVIEVALAVILVIGATALVTSFLRLTSVDPGFRPGEVLTTRVSLPSERYRTSEQVATFYRSLLEELRRTRGIEHAAAVTSLPLGGWRFGTTFVVRGEAFDAARPPSAHIQHTSDGYIETLGLS